MLFFSKTIYHAILDWVPAVQKHDSDIVTGRSSLVFFSPRLTRQATKGMDYNHMATTGFNKKLPGALEKKKLAREKKEMAVQRAAERAQGRGKKRKHGEE